MLTLPVKPNLQTGRFTSRRWMTFLLTRLLPLHERVGKSSCFLSFGNPTPTYATRAPLPPPSTSRGLRQPHPCFALALAPRPHRLARRNRWRTGCPPYFAHPGSPACAPCFHPTCLCFSSNPSASILPPLRRCLNVAITRVPFNSRLSSTLISLNLLS